GSSFDVAQVLEVVMDLAFESVKADRGIILLLDSKTNELIPQVVRERDEPEREEKEDAPIHVERADGNGAIDQSDPPRIHASRTIINHVLKHNEGVLSSNAMADKRFSKGKSVHSLGIRSAMCVPIK